MSERATRGSGSASSGTRSESPNVFKSNVCAFTLGERSFALDVAIVGEVVTVEAYVPVPLSPPAIRGIFNLRGVPVALVDLSALLETTPAPSDDGPKVALVLKTDDMTVGLAVDRLEGVISSGTGAFVGSDAPEEHPLVQGFLEVGAPGEPVITVLEPRAVVERLDAMKYLLTRE
jgi:purine-binding chemotaxis protein CheW